MAKNDVTGDRLVSKAANTNYLNNFDRIFNKGKDNAKQPELQEGLQDGVQEAGSFDESEEAKSEK